MPSVHLGDPMQEGAMFVRVFVPLRFLIETRSPPSLLGPTLVTNAGPARTLLCRASRALHSYFLLLRYSGVVVSLFYVFLNQFFRNVFLIFMSHCWFFLVRHTN